MVVERMPRNQGGGFKVQLLPSASAQYYTSRTALMSVAPATAPYAIFPT